MPKGAGYASSHVGGAKCLKEGRACEFTPRQGVNGGDTTQTWRVAVRTWLTRAHLPSVHPVHTQ